MSSVHTLLLYVQSDYFSQASMLYSATLHFGICIHDNNRLDGVRESDNLWGSTQERMSSARKKMIQEQEHDSSNVSNGYLSQLQMSKNINI